MGLSPTSLSVGNAALKMYRNDKLDITSSSASFIEHYGYSNPQPPYAWVYRYQNTLRVTVTTDAAGVGSLSFSISGWHTVGTTTTDGKVYWAISTSASWHPNSGTQCTKSGSSPRLSGTISSASMMPNTTYYVWIWADGYVGAYNGTLTLTPSGTYGAPGDITTKVNGTDVTGINFLTSSGDTGVTIAFGSSTSGGRYTVTISVPLTSGTATVNALTNSSDTSYVWKPLYTAFAPDITDRKSVTATITVQTYFGGVLAGTKTKTLTLTLTQAQVGVEITTGCFACSAYNAGAISGKTGYIQGYSKAKLDYDSSKVTLKQNAIVSKWSVKVGSASAADVAAGTASYTTANITADSTVTCTVTDSRGFTASADFSIIVLPYSNPTMTVEMYRCDQYTDTPSDLGNRLAITATGVISSLDGQNSMTIGVKWKQEADANWTDKGTLTSGAKAFLTTLSTSTYQVMVTLTDSLSNQVTVVATVPSSVMVLHTTANGDGAAIGKAAEYSGALQIPNDWDYMVGPNKLIDLIYPVGSIFMSTSSTDPGTYLGGTWARITGKFLLAATDGGNSGAAQAAGNTGGEAAHTLDTTEIPAHTHRVYSGWSAQSGADDSLYYGAYTGAYRYYGNGAKQFIENTGGGGAHNNMPPYLSVYMWQRTA